MLRFCARWGRRGLGSILIAACIVSLHAQQPPCDDAQQCRQLALEAAERRDYEAFHDLAWRAVQKGPPGDPEFMFLLARAQSLSGRPHDALVMLKRLVDRGVAIDVATDDDFRRVRNLRDWPLLEKLLAPAPTASPAPPAAPAPSTPVPESAPAAPVSFVPTGGLAYDAVSARFIVGDHNGRKLLVIPERATRPQDFVRAESAGFSNITAVEIDRRRGDLWVVSANATLGSTLHKLQLISGRPLEKYEAEDARFVDVALLRDGAPLALDAAGRRVLLVRRGAKGFTAIASFKYSDARSLAPIAENTILIAHRDGLGRLDAARRRSVSLKGGRDIDVRDMRWIRAHGSGLVAMQASGDGCRLVRLTLDETATRVKGVQTLQDNMPGGCPPATISEDELFYLQRDAGEMVIRRVAVPQE